MMQDYYNQKRPLRYNVELWEWTDHMRIDSKQTLKDFTCKKEAEEFVQERMMQGLVTKIQVFRSTLKNDYPFTPIVECKRIVYYDELEEEQ